MEFALVFLVAIIVGVLGSMLGVGGGILIVPLLTLVLDLPVTTAIGTSLVCVVVTSSASQVVYAGRGITNPRLGMLLEVTTTMGGLLGAFLALAVNERFIYVSFACVLVYMAVSMGRDGAGGLQPPVGGVFDTEYVDPGSGETVAYGVRRVPFGLAGGLGAGVVSGLLGVGGGIIKVPLMSLAMGVPLKAAIATSNLMIGVTAATGALVFFTRGYVDPRYAVPTVFGVIVGAQLGSRLAGRAPTVVLRRMFQVIAAVLAVQMAWKGLS